MQRALAFTVLAAAVAMCVAAVAQDGLLAHVGADGVREYFRDSTGSNSDTDMDLFVALLLLPSGVLRAARSRARPWLAELAVAGVAWHVAGTIWTWEALTATRAVTGDPWLWVYEGAWWVFGAGVVLAGGLGWFPSLLTRPR